MLLSSSSTTISMINRELSSAIRVESPGRIFRIVTFWQSIWERKSSSRFGTYSGFMISLKKPSYRSLSPFTPVHRFRNSSCCSGVQLLNFVWSVLFLQISASTSSFSRIMGKYFFNFAVMWCPPVCKNSLSVNLSYYNKVVGNLRQKLPIFTIKWYPYIFLWSCHCNRRNKEKSEYKYYINKLQYSYKFVNSDRKYF